ncbi:cell wall hydrolase [Sphingomonas aracearum]|uniref:cell wall hydrolase n=1 Tax=Sphingomonas aracearum TaxID=2283317 RepID=UPI001EF14F05|nr:cell wall hydrolase [Sphingomonas aracearum]
MISAALLRPFRRPVASSGLARLALLLFLAFSAQAAIRAAAAIRAHPVDAKPGQLRKATLRVAVEPLPAEVAALARGATGTIALPALPVAAATYVPSADDGTVRPAQPFSTRRATLLDRGRALDCLATAIYYEAASESDDGQRAVAQVILNRVRHPAFPATVCGVVYQGSERASGCQFSYACDGAMARLPSRAGMARAARIAAAALAGYVYAPVGLATHYHTFAVTPAWNRQLVMTAAIGAHFFHRWQGWWGTPAAFSRNYVGGEPIPGPHLRVPPAPNIPALLAAAAAPPPSAPVALTRAETIQPTYSEAGMPIVPTANGASPADPLPASGQILDRWKDSGKPLR